MGKTTLPSSINLVKFYDLCAVPKTELRNHTRFGFWPSFFPRKILATRNFGIVGRLCGYCQGRQRISFRASNPPSSSKLERVRSPSNPRAHHHYNQHPSYQPHQASNQPGLPDPMPSGCHQIIEFWKPPASQDRVIEFWKPLASQDRVKVVRGVRLPSHTVPYRAIRRHSPP